MYTVTPDLSELVSRTQRGDLQLDKLVVIEEHPDFPGELLFQPGDQRDRFYTRYHEWISLYFVLNELFNLPAFIEKLCEDGYEPVFGSSCEHILTAMATDWMRPLEIEGYSLHPFQQFGLRRAFSQDYFFFNWSTGAGKSYCCAAGAKHLVEQGEIDLVIACTVSKSKLDLCRFFVTAGLDAVVNDGTKAKRRKVYEEGHQVYVANYQKLHFDEEQIEKLVRDKRVLWVFDECHKVIYSGLNNTQPNLARRSFTKLRSRCAPGTKVWPMSASVLNGDPLRFRDVFNLRGDNNNPLGTRQEFLNRYADEVRVFDIEVGQGRTFPLTVPSWSLSRLQEVRHRSAGMTQAVRKTSPGVREFFKGLQTIVEPVQMSREERQIADAITDRAWELYTRHRDEQTDTSLNLGPYYSLLRYLCNTPLALSETGYEQWAELAPDLADVMKHATSSKLDKLNEQLESIREGGDKVVVFTAWTNLTLHLIKSDLAVPSVVHFGVGQSEKESQEAKQRFLEDPDITCFFTSDAGSHGLNLQVARYVIQYEPTYSYDLGMQRASRIDRADSHLDGLTNYVYLTEDSVEERVWSVNNARRVMASTVQGTAEVLSYEAGRQWTPVEAELVWRSERDNTAWLLFGERMQR